MNDQSLRAASKRSLPPEVQQGALLAGRYRIGRLLGSGGMGAVLAAEHVELNELVAIKVLLRDAAAQASPEALGRFTREAWAASKIKSEYVARVNDLGRLEDGTPYIVMEYLDGTDLEGLLHAQGALALEQALELMLQACEALAEAHALGIFHRDLKPSNLFCVLRSDGVMAIKLLDFGISKIAPAAASIAEQRLTGTASTLGTPLYMSPEQMRSGRVADQRSDIWSLGVILYEMLLDRVPFEAENLADLAIRIATEKPAPVTKERADVPAGLEQVIMRCLEKESANRFQTVAELARALAPFAPPRAAAHAERAERILTAQSVRSMPVVNTTRSSALSASGRGSHARLRANNADTLAVKRLRPQTIAIGVALTVLVAVLAIALLRRGNSQPSPETATERSKTRSNALVTPRAAAGATESQNERQETRANAAAVPPSAAGLTGAAAVPRERAEGRSSESSAQAASGATQPGAATAPLPAAQPAAAATSSGSAQTQARTSRSAPKTRDPVLSEPPLAAPPSAATRAPTTVTTEKRDRAGKASAPSTARDSELDSLGGRL